MRRTRGAVFFVAGALASLVVVLALQAAGALPKTYSPYRKLNVFARVLTYVENNYVEDVDESRLIYGAIKGMMDTLDPHSTFMPPEEYRQMKVDTQGEFGGVGIEVELRNGWITVVAPLEGSPAQKLGLHSGDIIKTIDGRSAREMKLHEAIHAMRGPRGTSVEIEVERQGEKKLLRFRIVRDVIKVVSVSSRMLEPSIGYVQLKKFQDQTAQQLGRTLQTLTKEHQLKGLILDLRNNPGGLLDQAVRVADLFIASGLIVRTSGKRGAMSEREVAHAKGSYTGFPMVCLVNGGSASAAEIVAGALQDHRRAVILGTRTFGKGSVQTIVDLDDGSGLKLTVARYYTPNGRSIQEHGIEPDIVVPEVAPPTRPLKIKREEDLARHLRGENAARQLDKGQAGPPVEDFQLQTALSHLKAAEIFRRQLN